MVCWCNEFYVIRDRAPSTLLRYLFNRLADALSCTHLFYCLLVRLELLLSLSLVLLSHHETSTFPIYFAFLLIFIDATLVGSAHYSTVYIPCPLYACTLVSLHSFVSLRTVANAGSESDCTELYLRPHLTTACPVLCQHPCLIFPFTTSANFRSHLSGLPSSCTRRHEGKHVNVLQVNDLYSSWASTYCVAGVYLLSFQSIRILSPLWKPKNCASSLQSLLQVHYKTPAYTHLRSKIEWLVIMRLFGGWDNHLMLPTDVLAGHNLFN